MAVDPIPALPAIGQGLQAIPARRVDALASVVVSLTALRAGEATNVIPEQVVLAGTVRTHDEAVRRRIADDIAELARCTAAAHRCTAEADYDFGYPVTVNDPDEAGFAATVAAEVVGAANVDADCPPEMGAEDFSYMLQARPGASVLLGGAPAPSVTTQPSTTTTTRARSARPSSSAWSRPACPSVAEGRRAETSPGPLAMFPVHSSLGA